MRSYAGVPRSELDSVYGSIYSLLNESKFTEAHTLIEGSLEKYKDETRFVSALYLAMSDAERLSGNVDIALKHIRTAENVMHSIGEDYWNLKKNTLYQRLANLYFEMGMEDSSFYYAQKSIDAAMKYHPVHISTMQTLNWPIIGNYYFKKGKYDLAEEIYGKLIKLNNDSGYSCGNASAYEKIAEIKAFSSTEAEAIFYAEKAYYIADTCKMNHYKMAAVNRLVWIAERFNDDKKLAGYLKLKMSLMEQIQIHEQKTKLQEMETVFGSKLKDEENRSLKAINEEHRIRGMIQIVAIILSILLFLIALLFALSYWRQKKRIAEQKEDVERLNLLNQKIFSVISHDFKGPMLGIDVLLKVHEKYGMDRETFSDQATALRSELLQANLVMDNLLDWSKTELGFADFQKKTCGAKAICDEIIRQLQSSLRQKKLQVENRVSAENMLPIPPDILKIIFRNLLSNAIKYSHENGVIVFEYNPDANHYVLKDEGIGMDEEQQNGLFVGSVNSRLGTRHESGYGIGLQLVYELVQKNNGRIWGESKLNKGTSIYFSFG